VDFIKNNVEIDNPEAVATLLMQQEANQQVVKLVSPASQPLRKNWLVYKSKFIEPTRIKSGVNFWNQNSELLAKVENEFQVDASVIVGIIGVESIFGKHMGNFNVLNTLYTLAFYYPDTPNKQAREQMFQKQLANYIVWTQSNQANMYTHIGSFAGAMGMPQFMPESIQKYAIDYDNDGTINLSTSIPDVVASVANFLKQHGWKSGEKVILDVDKTPENIALLKANATGKPKPSLTFQDLPSLNFNYANNGLNPDTKLLVVDLPSGSDVDYKIGLENFYVLTRYNQSFFYALSVYELGKSIADARSSNSNQVIPIAFKSR
jgi:membrane-bound lytic murein transglycosylase B